MDKVAWQEMRDNIDAKERNLKAKHDEKTIKDLRHQQHALHVSHLENQIRQQKKLFAKGQWDMARDYNKSGMKIGNQG